MTLDSQRPSMPGAQPAPTPAPAPPADPRQVKTWAFVCYASDCRYSGAPAVAEALAGELQRQGSVDVGVVRTGCLSLCGAGPALVTFPEGDIHLHVEPADAADLAAQLGTGKGLARRMVRAPQWYRDQIRSRLGYFVEMLRRRAETAGPAA